MNLLILPGLPGQGDAPKQFTQGSKRTHSEGLVVAFSGIAASWIGNFQRGIGACSDALPHPDGRHAIVVASGQGYVIDPVRRALVDSFGGGIEALWRIPSEGLVIFDNAGIEFRAIGVSGWRWCTPRVSWDGFEDLALDERRLTGRAWDAVNEQWEPFAVDLRSGLMKGGAFNFTERSSNERCN